MSGYDETVMFGPSVQQLALAEGSGAKGLECSRESALDFQTEVETMVEQVRRLSRDKPEHFAAGARKIRLLLDEIQTDKAPVDKIQTDKAPVDKIQMEKMDKAPVVYGEEAPVFKIQMEKMDKAPVVDGEDETGEETLETGCCDDSAGEKYRLPDDYVRSILAMTRTPPREHMRVLQTPNLAKLLGVAEESLEEDRRRLYGEGAARSKRINDDLELFQDEIRQEWERNGFVEVDDEYMDNLAKMQAYDEELWKDYDWSGFEFSDPDDPDYACWYEPAKEELCTVN